MLDQEIINNHDVVNVKIAVKQLETEIFHIHESIEEIKGNSQKTTLMIQSIQQTLSEARGGWKAFITIGGFLVMVSGWVYWIINHLNFK